MNTPSQGIGTDVSKLSFCMVLEWSVGSMQSNNTEKNWHVFGMVSRDASITLRLMQCSLLQSLSNPYLTQVLQVNYL